MIKSRLTLFVSMLFIAGCNSSSTDSDVILSSPTDPIMYADSGNTTTKSFTVTLDANSNAIMSLGATSSYNVTISGLEAPFTVSENNCSSLTTTDSCSFRVSYSPTDSSQQNISDTFNVAVVDHGSANYTIMGKAGLNVVIFGDSLSDGGYQDNLIATSGWPTIPDTSTLKSPTFTTPIEGGGVWAGYLDDYSGSTIKINNTDPVISSSTTSGNLDGSNYAAGGATTTCTGITSSSSGTVIYSPPPIGPQRADATACADSSIQNHNQIDNYLNTNGDKANADSIYIIWGGANNLFKGQALGEDESQLQQTMIDAAKDIAYDVDYLYDKGGRKFIVLNLPNIGATPSVTEDGGSPDSDSALAATALSELYNSTLITELDSLSASLDGINIKQIDSFTLLDRIISDKNYSVLGADFGFDNTTQMACTYNADDMPSAINCIPDDGKLSGYLFEDGVHPTTEMHEALAYTIFKEIEQLEQD
ncbi:MAG: SGNH/GDSL hydrolase family protein [Francisellaceae bacterium]